MDEQRLTVVTMSTSPKPRIINSPVTSVECMEYLNGLHNVPNGTIVRFDAMAVYEDVGESCYSYTYRREDYKWVFRGSEP